MHIFRPLILLAIMAMAATQCYGQAMIQFIDTIHDMFNYVRLKNQMDADKEVADIMEEHLKGEEDKK